jgi:DNA polymerase III delta prime subunit
MMEDYLWAQKYRPKTIDECILPDDLKQTFKKFVEDENVPNLILTGRAGIGKTTVACAMLEEIGSDYIVINGSLDGSIDVLRTKIQQFASTVSFVGGRKYVVIDEGDYLTHATQPALRNFIEEYSKNCGFILTCNFLNKIIDPLQSRFSVINFSFQKEDAPKLAASFYKRVQKILDENAIKYDQASVAMVIKKYYPDWRKCLNELQRYSTTGAIDSGILSNFSEISLNQLIGLMKERNFTEVRQWVSENTDQDTSRLFRALYDNAVKYIKTSSIPQLVLILAEYQYKNAFVTDHEINLAACMAEIMVQVEFKD